MAPSVELTLQLGNVRVCTSSAHPCSMAAAPPCQSPGQWEGQLACVITAGPAQRSAWPPYLRGPLLPLLLQKPPGSSPCPSSVSGRRADTLPGKGSTRGSAPCGPCLLWTDCDPLTWVICPPPPSPWNVRCQAHSALGKPRHFVGWRELSGRLQETRSRPGGGGGSTPPRALAAFAHTGRGEPRKILG